MNYISSPTNDRIKLLRSLGNRKSRKECGRFLIEGVNLLGDAPSGYVDEVYVREDKQEELKPLIDRLGGTSYVVKDFVFDKISDTVSSAGILATAELPEPCTPAGNVVAILDGISDPGNLGTIIRTGVAMGIYDYISLNSADAYAPKTVRATMGGVYYANVVDFSYAGAREFLEKNNYKVLVLDMGGKDIYGYELAPTDKLAIVVGSEAHGVSEEMRSASSATLAIPMYGGKIESLNAAVSASISFSVLTSKLR